MAKNSSIRSAVLTELRLVTDRHRIIPHMNKCGKVKLCIKNVPYSGRVYPAVIDRKTDEHQTDALHYGCIQHNNGQRKICHLIGYGSHIANSSLPPTWFTIGSAAFNFYLTGLLFQVNPPLGGSPIRTFWDYWRKPFTGTMSSPSNNQQLTKS